MTHKELVKKAVLYLNNRKKCTVVINELKSIHTSEEPDALGFKGGVSTLIEVKISRSDFNTDKKKPFRRDPSRGMGNLRYYLAPVRTLTSDDLPPNWGLIEYYESGQFRESVKAEFIDDDKVNKRAEVALLSAAIRRLKLSTCVFVERGEGDDIVS